MKYKLGKHPPKANLKTLLFSKYLKADAPPPPPKKVFREYKIPLDAWQMFGNDTLGDCTCAAVAHMLMLVTAHTGKLVIPDLNDVLVMYSIVSGYVPGDASTDNGAAITDVLEYWQMTGLSGHKIRGWAAINYADLLARHQGIYIFGANDIGVQLPMLADTQFIKKKTWDIAPDDGGIAGGHCIVEAGYGSQGSDFVTWGQGGQKATNAWSAKYVDEAYVVVTQDWISQADGLAPNALDLDTLQADLQALRA